MKGPDICILSAAEPCVFTTQVLHGRQLGIDCVVILEQYAELATLLEAAARLGVQPAIGVRARLSTHHGG